MKPIEKKTHSLSERKDYFHRMLKAFEELEFDGIVLNKKRKKNGNK